MDRCLRIGLSGGIGSGKSEVSRRFESLGTPVFDADRISRELVEPGQPALRKILQRFGPRLADRNGELKRAALREMIFDDSEARRALEAILHPLVRARLLEQASRCKAGYCILSIPLLLETGFDTLVDRILIVDTSPELQLQRASLRDGASTSQLQAIIDSQIDRSQRLQAADDVISNESGLAQLEQRVQALHQRYQELAGQP